MELLVALVVLSLAATLAFTGVGPGLAMAKFNSQEAAFWRAVGPAQLLLSELATGAIDPSSRRVTETTASFRTLAPRLTATPFTARLMIEADGENQSRLVLQASELSGVPSVVLAAPGGLRFANKNQTALALELRRNGVWSPIAVSQFVADAPFQCAFDPIPRTCR